MHLRLTGSQAPTLTVLPCFAHTVHTHCTTLLCSQCPHSLYYPALLTLSTLTVLPCFAHNVHTHCTTLLCSQCPHTCRRVLCMEWIEGVKLTNEEVREGPWGWVGAQLSGKMQAGFMGGTMMEGAPGAWHRR